MDGRAAARAAIEEAHAAGGRICAFFCESILSCGGQVQKSFDLKMQTYFIYRPFAPSIASLRECSSSILGSGVFCLVLITRMYK